MKTKKLTKIYYKSIGSSDTDTKSYRKFDKNWFSQGQVYFDEGYMKTLRNRKNGRINGIEIIIKK